MQYGSGYETDSFRIHRVPSLRRASLLVNELSMKGLLTLDRNSSRTPCRWLNKFTELFITRALPSTTPWLSVSTYFASPVDVGLTFRFHSVYNELATTFSRKISTHEKAVQALSEMKDEVQREAATLRLQEHILPDLEATRKDLEVFQEQAVRVCRQSVIMAERTQGIDHPDTIQQYSDLALLEQPADLSAGLALSKHALNLWTAAYGPDHPTVHSILVRTILRKSPKVAD